MRSASLQLGLGEEPPAGPKGRVPGQRVKKSLPEAESFEAFVCLKEGLKRVAKMSILSKYLAIHLTWSLN